MKNEEILDAIVALRDDLALIAGTTDADKQAALVVEKVVPVGHHIDELVRRTHSFGPPLDHLRAHLQEMLFSASPTRVNSAPECKKELIDAVAKYAPKIIDDLDDVAQALREKRQ